MEKPLIIIKFGGSVITEKDIHLPKVRINILKQLVTEIKKIIDLNKYRLIIVHGAGSFGHPLATKYRLQNGINTPEQVIGFSLTAIKVQELNSLVLSFLSKMGVPVIGMSPHAFVKQSNKQLIALNHTLVSDFINKGFIPVLYGDMVLDNATGGSIISGDVIVSYLAKKLKARQVIFLSDVDGICDSDPKLNPKAKLIPEVNNNNLRKVLNGTAVSNKNDTTGQMSGKILNIKQHLSGVLVYIVNGLKKGSLTKAIDKDQIGTKLHFL